MIKFTDIRIGLAGLLLAAALGVAPCARALDLKSLANMDSIAAMGRFGRFCADVYRWGDRTFNSFDTAYVASTGYRWKANTALTTWENFYDFRLSNDVRIGMFSEPTVSLGFHVSYLALSMGYDLNLSQFLGFNPRARRRFSTGFTCALLSVDFFHESNNSTNYINLLDAPGGGGKRNPHLTFSGASIGSWGINAYYFFNNRRYSQSAAFGFGRLQRRTAGSWFAGFSYTHSNYNFDFSAMPDFLLELLPAQWDGYRYRVRSRDYSLKVGYGINFVAGRGWMLCVQESPMLGMKRGTFNGSPVLKTRVALNNQMRGSVVFNRGRWFAGAQFDLFTGVIYNRGNSFLDLTWNAVATAGARF